MWIIYTIMVIVLIVISLLWAKGITDMDKNHSDYKGEDWLDWDEDEKLDINLWDKEDRKDYDEN
jgi:hypothetical protein